MLVKLKRFSGKECKKIGLQTIIGKNKILFKFIAQSGWKH